METRSKKIYVADDDEDILQIISLMLQTEGYRVETSRDASGILAFEKTDLPDLILLDIWMSGVDGGEVCRSIKQHADTRHIPVLFISANSNIEEITKAHEADGFIAKPFEMDDMLKKIHNTLQRVV
jgi:CheY-like chemotaxis protein